MGDRVLVIPCMRMCSGYVVRGASAMAQTKKCKNVNVKIARHILLDFSNSEKLRSQAKDARIRTRRMYGDVRHDDAKRWHASCGQPHTPETRWRTLDTLTCYSHWQNVAWVPCSGLLRPPVYHAQARQQAGVARGGYQK